MGRYTHTKKFVALLPQPQKSYTGGREGIHGQKSNHLIKKLRANDFLSTHLH